MNARFFALAFAAAINPTLLAVDLILIVNRRPRPMITFVLLGGLAMAVTIGLVDVLIIRSNVQQTQGGLGPGADLAIGLFLLIAAAILFATGRKRRSHDPPAATGHREEGKAERRKSEDGWMRRALREPRPLLAVVVGAALGLPGGLYLAALHGLTTGSYSTATQVIGVVVFAVIEFALLIIPIILLVTRPQATGAFLERTNNWLAVHGRQAGIAVALVLGTYLTVSGLVGLLSLWGQSAVGMLDDFDALGAQVGDGSLRGVGRDSGRQVDQYSHRESEFGGVGGRSPDAVVRRDAGDIHGGHPAFAEPVSQ